MAFKNFKSPSILRDNSFYRKHYPHFFWGTMVMMVFLIAALSFILYQSSHRPWPVFSAVQPEGQQMLLTAFEEPNLLPDTIIKWASKGTTAAYTFDFVRYKAQLQLVRPYFTEQGWNSYLRSVDSLINSILQGQLFVDSIVNGTPVISNQGSLPSEEYVWRVQIPFLVTYQAASSPEPRRYYVILTIVRVPTSINPQGIGISQFVMTELQ